MGHVHIHETWDMCVSMKFYTIASGIHVELCEGYSISFMLSCVSKAGNCHI